MSETTPHGDAETHLTSAEGERAGTAQQSHEALSHQALSHQAQSPLAQSHQAQSHQAQSHQAQSHQAQSHEALSHQAQSPETQSHEARWMAESFGTDPARYDRARPHYPDALVERIVSASPGRDVLDVGVGTGIAARQFVAAGCRVLGVDVDERMAAFARATGLDVEVAPFERWDSAGRSFDAVVAAQTWHWVDPVAGAVKAASVLRPGGRFAAFWNAGQPPADLAEAFAAVYRRVVPEVPMFGRVAPASVGYSAFYGKTAEGLRAAGGFGEPEPWEVAWDRTYTRDEWLDQVPTSGGHSRFPADRLSALLDGIGAAIDAAGGSFVVRYTTIAATATATGTRAG